MENTNIQTPNNNYFSGGVSALEYGQLGKSATKTSCGLSTALISNSPNAGLRIAKSF